MERTITVTLELRLDGECLTGRATAETGAAREFSGWLGLNAAIDALVAPDRAPAGPAAGDARCE